MSVDHLAEWHGCGKRIADSGIVLYEGSGNRHRCDHRESKPVIQNMAPYWSRSEIPIFAPTLIFIIHILSPNP